MTRSFTVSRVSARMAPGARLSIYKVLYENAANTTSSGSSVDIAAAVEAAVNATLGASFDAAEALLLARLGDVTLAMLASKVRGRMKRRRSSPTHRGGHA